MHVTPQLYDPICKKRKSLNRSQCYGGEAGVFFSKRKHEKKRQSQFDSSYVPSIKSSHEYNQPKRQLCEEKEITESVIDRSDIESKTSSKPHNVKHGTSETHLIGWDDVLCRPIFKKIRPVTTISPCSYDDDESVSSSPSSTPVKQEKKDLLEGLESPKPFWSMPLTGSKNNKNRSYGRGKGKYKRLTLSASSKATLEESRKNICSKNSLPIVRKRNISKLPEKDKIGVSVKPKINLYLDQNEPRNKTKSGQIHNEVRQSLILTPEIYEKSVCSALDSDVKGKKRNERRTSRFSLRQNKSHPIPKFDNLETSHTNEIELSQSKKSDSFETKAKISAKLPQPTHKTPLHVARAFFEDLDKNEVLKIQTYSHENDTKGNTDIRREPMRTRRLVNLSDPTLKRQYSSYCNAARDSGVPPINITEFVKSRGSFFETHGMFDGILEEI